jgi:[protein-PII] uridylyltransferase
MISVFRAKRQALEEKWTQGGPNNDLLLGLCRLVDEFIVDSYEQATVQGGDDRTALVALGGYGRRELFPFSDIDLMILYHPKMKKQIAGVTDAVLYPLWDTGMEVGHGVRTVAESISHAREDYFFLVALLDARLICGSEHLFNELLQAYRKRYVDGHREKFVEKMKVHRQSRRERFGSHSYLLEPHIKEGRGGMRDIQAMMWTARVVFGLNTLDDIQGAGLLLDEEKKAFVEARSTLVRLRCHLHLMSKRKTDQLYFEQQEDVARLFNYHTSGGVRGVELFMRDTYSALQTISVVTDLFFDHVDEVLGLAGKSKMVADRVIESGIEIKTGRVHLTASRSQLVAKPQTLIRVFLAMSRTGLPMHHRSRKVLSELIGLITDKERTSPRFAKTFFTLLLEAKDIAMVLATMLETGVLTACVPEFANITSLAQHDLYHIYTVDRHSLQAVAELHSLVASGGGAVQKIKEMKVLYLAALLHDIGKGSGRDHSLEGAALAGEIGQRFCLTKEECDTLTFLVRYHLFIPENALRRDLNDAIFIKRCAETIGDLSRLAMLYLLSVADSKATGPSAWSDWKATLMEELYLKICPYLEHGPHEIHDATVHEEQGVEWLREQIRLQLKGAGELKIDPETLSTDYILSFSPQVIAGHVLTLGDNFQRIRQKSLIVAEKGDESWSLLIMTKDRPGLLAKICGVMALNNLSVVKAQIFTWKDGTVVDVIDVRSTNGLSFAEKDWKALNDQLDLAIEHRMGLSHRLYSKLSSTYSRRKQMVGDVASKIVFDNESSDTYTVIEVYAADLPAQLYHITQAMADFGLNIHKAYIATEVEQLIDVFYVLDSRGQKLVDEGFVKEVTEGILHFTSHSAK